MSPFHLFCLLNQDADTLVCSSQRTQTLSLKSGNNTAVTPFLILPDTRRNENKTHSGADWLGSSFQSVIYQFEKVSTSNRTIKIMFASQLNHAKIYQLT